MAYRNAADLAEAGRTGAEADAAARAISQVECPPPPPQPPQGARYIGTQATMVQLGPLQAAAARCYGKSRAERVRREGVAAAPHSGHPRPLLPRRHGLSRPAA